VDSKSNEITAIQALLKLLDIAGCIITIDAMGTQTAIAQQIVDKQAQGLPQFEDVLPQEAGPFGVDG